MSVIHIDMSFLLLAAVHGDLHCRHASGQHRWGHRAVRADILISRTVVFR